MQTRTVRACGIAVVGLLTALAASSVSADTPNTPRPEPSLLGVKLMASYSDVMRKFGQPNEIQIGDPTVTGNGQSAVAGGPGMMGRAGGLPGMAGMMGRPGGMQGMMSSSPGGMQGMMGRVSGMQGMMSSSPGGMQGMMGGRGMQGMMSSSPGGAGGGLPGLGPRSGGAPGGYPGMGGANTAGAQDSGESTWWYHFPHEGLHYSFLFNKDGRVIQIQAYGQKPDAKIVAPRSALGITLGADLGQVIKKYGWSNDGEHSGDYVVLRYGKRDRIAFQTVNNKVKGIVLGRVNPEPANNGFPALIGSYPGGSGTGMGVGGGPGGGE